MFSIKVLDGGGDVAVKQMLDTASVIGTDLIELLWIPRNKQPHRAVITVVGYKVPVINNNINVFDDERPDSSWIDGIVNFYPDENGRCWGYIYDTQVNRDLLATSLASGWFKIVDKNIKEEIIKLAKKRELPTEPYPTLQCLTKKSVTEKVNEEKIKKMEDKEQELKDRLKMLEDELLRVKGDKATNLNQRLKGIRIPKDTDIEEEK